MSEHLENGRRFLKEGNVDAAAAAFSASLEQDGDSAEARYGLARANLELDEVERAIEDYRKGLELEPEGAASAELAALLLAREEEDEARKLVDQALELDPDHYKAYVLMAELAVRDNEWEAADEMLRKGIRRGADVAAGTVFGMYQSWVGDLVGGGNPEKASEVSGRAAKFFKDNTHLTILAAGAAEAAGDPEAALSRYKRALEDLPPGNVRNQILEKIAALS